MRQILISMCAIFSMVIQGCVEKKPTYHEIIGTWESSDGIFIFNEDSTFVGKSLPAECFTFYTSKEQVEGKKINGIGKWKLEKGEGFEEIKLHFQQIDNNSINGFYSVLVSSEENRDLKKKSPWYLFLWRDEEGGERYKFFKK